MWRKALRKPVLRHPTTSRPFLQRRTSSVLRILRRNPATPVRVDRLNFLLTEYPADLKHFLILGFCFGFRISYVGERQTFESRNLKSALEKPHVVLSKLNKEREAGRIAGPVSYTHLTLPTSDLV